MRSEFFLGVLALAAAANGIAVGRSGSHASIKNFKSKIKHVVVLVMENRSLDNLLGGQTLKGLDNPINTGPYCNPYNVTNPKEGKACTAAGDYNSIVDDPDHAVTGNNFEFYGTYTPDNTLISEGQLRPRMMGFVHEQISNYESVNNKTLLAQQVMDYYTEEQVAVITTLVQNFVTFNHWHSDIAGPTNPNRVALMSGTSAGQAANTFPYGFMMQRSIFQQLSEIGLDWRNYVTDTSEEDALWFNWTYTSNNTHKVQPLANFWRDAQDGNLTHFTVVDPSCCGVGTNSMHPQGLISDGLTLIKDVYEALRASPQWDESMLLITFDETGGFHDHVPPPKATPPDNLTYTTTTPDGQNYTYAFDRLGGRMPTFLISPWVQKAHVEQKGTNYKNRIVSYSASSMLRTLGYLWDFEPFNPRVENSPSFDGLITKKKRTDTPKTLPTVTNFTFTLT